MRKPDLGRERGRAHARPRRARHGDHGCDDRAHRRPAGFCRLRPRPLSASQARRARHPDRRASRHRASRRHAGKTEVAARGQQVLRPRHLRHEGRQLPDAGSDPATGARVVHDAAADHRAVHAGRGSRHALDPRHHRGRSRAQQIRAGAGAGPRRTTASSPDVTRSRASISKPSASRATPAPRCPRAAPRSARWRARSSPSTA